MKALRYLIALSAIISALSATGQPMKPAQRDQQGQLDQLGQQNQQGQSGQPMKPVRRDQQGQLDQLGQQNQQDQPDQPMKPAAPLTLERCRQMARNNYPLIRKYGLIDATEGYSLTNASKAWIPQVSLGAQATLQNKVPAFPDEFSGLLTQMGIDMPGLRNDQYKVTVDVTQMVWDGGKTKADKEIAKADAQQQRSSTDVDLYAVESRVDDLYFGILLLDGNLSQVVASIDLLQSNLDQARSLVRNGAAMQSDADVIEAELLTAGQTQRQLKASEDSYRAMLGIFVGEKIPEGPLAKPEAQEVPFFKSQSPDLAKSQSSGFFKSQSPDLAKSQSSGFVKSQSSNLAKPQSPDLSNPQASETLATEVRRPELTSINAGIKSIEARQKLLNASTMPYVSLFAQGYYGYPGFDYFASMMNSDWTMNGIVGVKIGWNLSSFYTKASNRNKLETEKAQLNLQKDIFLFNTDLQATSQNGEIARLRDALKDDERIAELRSNARKAAESKLRNGVIDTNDLLKAITDEKNALTAKNNREIELLKTIYQLKHTVNQ